MIVAAQMRQPRLRSQSKFSRRMGETSDRHKSRSPRTAASKMPSNRTKRCRCAINLSFATCARSETSRATVPAQSRSEPGTAGRPGLPIFSSARSRCRSAITFAGRHPLRHNVTKYAFPATSQCGRRPRVKESVGISSSMVVFTPYLRGPGRPALPLLLTPGPSQIRQDVPDCRPWPFALTPAQSSHRRAREYRFSHGRRPASHNGL